MSNMIEEWVSGDVAIESDMDEGKVILVFPTLKVRVTEKDAYRVAEAIQRHAEYIASYNSLKAEGKI